MARLMEHGHEKLAQALLSEGVERTRPALRDHPEEALKATYQQLKVLFGA